MASCRQLIMATVVLLLSTMEAAPASAAPTTLMTASTILSAFNDLTPVRGRQHAGAEVAAGLAAGLMIGGLLAAPQYDYPYYRPYYYPPPFVGPVDFGGPGWVAYCLSRYRSFDPSSGTYLGYDGRRHFCR